MLSGNRAHLCGSFFSRGLVGTWVIAGCEFSAGVPPLRLLIPGFSGHRPERANGLAVNADCRGRDLRAGGLVHEGHEFIREARHGATDADTAHVGATADAGHPTTLGHVAIHHRSPATKLHDALGRAIRGGEIALFVGPGAIATVVHSSLE